MAIRDNFRGYGMGGVRGDRTRNVSWLYGPLCDGDGARKSDEIMAMCPQQGREMISKRIRL